jgi:dihydroorotate dehydrogenase
MFGPGLVLTSEACFLLLLQVINISSPNTPGLRKLQGRKQLKDLVKKVCSCFN